MMMMMMMMNTERYSAVSGCWNPEGERRQKGQ